MQMDHKHMKWCSTSFLGRDMPLKTTMKYHCTPIRIAKIKGSDNSKCWQGCEKLCPSHIASTILEKGVMVSYKTKDVLITWPRNCTLGHFNCILKQVGNNSCIIHIHGKKIEIQVNIKEKNLSSCYLDVTISNVSAYGVCVYFFNKKWWHILLWLFFNNVLFPPPCQWVPVLSC